MPPKRTTRSSSKAQEAPASNKKENKRENGIKDEDKMSIDSDESTRKRKAPPTDTKSSEPDKKASKKSAGDGSNPSIKQLLNFLLSAEALPYCYPEDELKASKSGDFKKTYSMTPPSSYTPFENLLTAHLLSKPLSHTLGMRSIRTLLNLPYSFSTPESITKAGEEKVHSALDTARTQHRQKTASYIHEMAQSYADDEKMYELAVAANDEGAPGLIKHIKSTVNGMGETGAQLFCRRIQAVDGWGEAVWPYADPKSLEALNKLGVKAKDGDELQELVERYVEWDKVGQMGLDKLVGTGREDDSMGDDAGGKVEDMDHELRVAVEFVVLLERGIGAVLEGKVEEVRKKAAEMA